MSGLGGGSNKNLTNSLLSAASEEFSFDDFANSALLVPVSLEEETAEQKKEDTNGSESQDKDNNNAFAIQEINLNEETNIPQQSNIFSLVQQPTNVASSLFTLQSDDNEEDPFKVILAPPSQRSLIPQSLTPSPFISVPPSVTPSFTPIPMVPVPSTEINQNFTDLKLQDENPSISPLPPQPFFINPSEIGSGESGAIQSRPSASNYRLGKIKPVYAQYPGLSSGNSQANVIPPTGQLTGSTPMANVPENVQNKIGDSLGSVPEVLTPSPGTLFHSHSQPQLSTQSSIPQPPPPSSASSMFFQNTAQNIEYSFGGPPPTSNSYVQPTLPMEYSPVTPHWFYKDDQVWKPFSFVDSINVEEAFTNNIKDPIPTDGGRFDVNVEERLRRPVYWKDPPSEVRRCSWFYKGPLDPKFVPYDEEFSKELEKEYQRAIVTGAWHNRMEVFKGETVIMHSPTVMAHFCPAAAPDEWGNVPESQLRPRILKRGVEEFDIAEGEGDQIDTLIFLVHGIGSICDFKMRSIVEAVSDFRSLCQHMIAIHFKDGIDTGFVGRIEFLPIAWHESLHGETGIDKRLDNITLPSIPRLRHFTNDTLLDILFYTSPFYAQTIINQVGEEMNRIFRLFLERNPTFNGNIALGGHSLGSLIIFDLLANQPILPIPIPEPEVKGEQEQDGQDKVVDPVRSFVTAADYQTPSHNSMSKIISFKFGIEGTGQPNIKYPVLDFHPSAFFAMGSPIAMFATIRGIDTLGLDFHFPTCPAFFNIYHPYDPVAYRIEPLLDSNWSRKPVLIPHHKGRKRFHYEFKAAVSRMGHDFKNRIFDSIKNTWNNIYSYASFSTNQQEQLESDISSAIDREFEKANVPLDPSVHIPSFPTEEELIEMKATIGKLNGGRRIDHVLQETPLESFNEYLFALSSHVCYWESEDTMLLIIKEIYNTMGIWEDSAGPPGSERDRVIKLNAMNKACYPSIDTSKLDGVFFPLPTMDGQQYRPVGPDPPQYPVPHWVTGLPDQSRKDKLSQDFRPRLEAPDEPGGPTLMYAPSFANLTSEPNHLPSGSNTSITDVPIGSTTPKNIIPLRPVFNDTTTASQSSIGMGMDPTAPIESRSNLAPPPLMGFVPKTS